MATGTTEPKRLYQKIAATLKERIQSDYKLGDRLPPERLIAEEMEISRTVVREAVIMLEVEGMVEVIKGSGIHVIAMEPKTAPAAEDELSTTYGPFELLQARQLLESNIAEFAAAQITKQEISALLEIQKHSREDDKARDSQWDKAFHIQIAKATKNSVLVSLVEELWLQRDRNPMWLKLHSHIDRERMDGWCNDHEQIIKALMRKEPIAAKMAMWQHLETIKQMLFNATTYDGDPEDDRYLFTDNPVIHLELMNN